MDVKRYRKDIGKRSPCYYRCDSTMINSLWNVPCFSSSHCSWCSHLVPWIFSSGRTIANTLFENSGRTPRQSFRDRKCRMNDRWFGTPSGSIGSRWSWCDERSTYRTMWNSSPMLERRISNAGCGGVGVGGWLLGEREHTHTHPAYPISSTLICVNVSRTDQRCSPCRRLFPCHCSTSQCLEPILNCLCSINSSNTRLICEVS